MDFFIVVERDGQIIACAALFPFLEEKCGEVAAIAVSPDCRGQGQGYKLLGMIQFSYYCSLATYEMRTHRLLSVFCCSIFSALF